MTYENQPLRIYVDTDGGNYGDASKLIIISGDGWTSHDTDVWEYQTDTFHIMYAEFCMMSSTYLSPSEYEGLSPSQHEEQEES